MINPFKFASLVSIAALSLGCASAGAQVRIGQTSGFTGPVATSVDRKSVV